MRGTTDAVVGSERMAALGIENSGDWEQRGLRFRFSLESGLDFL